MSENALVVWDFDYEDALGNTFELTEERVIVRDHHGNPAFDVSPFQLEEIMVGTTDSGGSSIRFVIYNPKNDESIEYIFEFEDDETAAFLTEDVRQMQLERKAFGKNPYPAIPHFGPSAFALLQN